MVKITAYPIKNYATNHLYVSGSNGQSAGVDWGSRSAVASRYDSLMNHRLQKLSILIIMKL